MVPQLTLSRMDVCQLLDLAHFSAVNVERIIEKSTVRSLSHVVHDGVSLLERCFLSFDEHEFLLCDLTDRRVVNAISKFDFDVIRYPLMNAIDVMLSYTEQHRYLRNHLLPPSKQ